MSRSLRSEKVKKILNDELDNLEFWEAFGKPITITKANRVSDLAHCLMWDKEEPRSPPASEIGIRELGRVITYDLFLS
jgi:hypothetical protein